MVKALKSRRQLMAGLIAGLVLGVSLANHDRVAEAARESLESLAAKVAALQSQMTAVETSVNGLTTGSTPAGDALALGGVSASGYAKKSDINPNAIDGDLDISGDFRALGSVQVGNTSAGADASTAGTLRWTGSELQVSDGIEWRSIAINGSDIQVPFGTTAQRPSSPLPGTLYLNFTTGHEEIFNGADWQNAN